MAALVLLAILAAGIQPLAAFESSSQNFRNTRSSLGSGGGAKTSGSFRQTGASGVVAGARQASAGFRGRGGPMAVFFYPAAPAWVGSSSGPVPGSIVLRWAAPGNDGSAPGTRARSYVLKLSSDPAGSPALSAAVFEAASTAAAPAPALQGFEQELTLAGLSAGTSYYFAIRALEADGGPGPVSAAATAYAAVAAPAAAEGTFSGVSSGGFSVAWSSGSPASGWNAAGTMYLAQVSADEDFSGVVLSSQTAGLQASFYALSPNTTYHARVSAFGNAARSQYAVMGATPTLARPLSGIQLAAVHRTSMTVGWQALPESPPAPSSMSALGYILEASTAPDFSGVVCSSETLNLRLSTLTVAGLAPNVTYYLRAGSLNWGRVANPAAIGYALHNLAVHGLAAATGFKSAVVSWEDLTDQEKGGSFTGYRVYRSSDAAGFSLRDVSASAVFVDTSVVVDATYSYRVTMGLSPGVETAAEATASVVVRSTFPVAPAMLRVAPAAGPSGAVVSWTAVTRFANGEIFVSSGAAVSYELSGYGIYRSTDPVEGPWTEAAAVSSATLSWADPEPGSYYYHVRAANTCGSSGPSGLRSGDGAGVFVLPDGKSTFHVPGAAMSALEAGSWEDSYSIEVSSESPAASAPPGVRVLKSVRLDALRGGAAPPPGFRLPAPATLRLVYGEPAGGAGPSAMALSARPAARQENASVFWHNGAKWLQLYGRTDPAAQAVTVQTGYLGAFQVRAVQRPSGFSADVLGIVNRFVTPNGDGRNDSVVFRYDNPGLSEVRGSVYDVKGAFVASMTPGPVRDFSLQWDGKANGVPVPGGVYIYRISSEGTTVTGTVVVIK